ncbi:cytokine receptor, partial [Halyomorpha halys]|uniref:cytokine receptor n=1 Tax=Halyomorpha halys TaxID=286706 RepID=UPI0006D4CD20
MYILIFLFSWGNIVAGDQGGCTPGWVIPGVTVPKGDIIVEYGNPLEILCILRTPTVYNSSLLRFYHDREEVSKELLSIVNETTLRLFVEKPPISSRLYFCKLMTAPNEFKGVCLNYVFVGTKPQAVQNFSCISYNWESLNCSWVPVKNPIRTEYHIVFTFTERKRNVYKCPDKSDIEDNFCHWSSETKPSYRSPYENYFFTLTGENKFGSLVRNYTINHFAVVVPRRPENLSSVNLTSSSLTISWVIPSHLRLFPPGIKDKVIYQSKWDPPNYWKEVNTSFVIKESERRVLNITGLKYANTIYDIRVLLKSEKAEDEEKWWSEPATITFRTKPDVPGMSPKTDVGSFECKAQETFRNIYIYWQQIPQYEENGEDLEYKILRIKELIGSKWIERNVWPSAVTKTYAFFTMMSFNRYNFTIAASNKEGISRETSHVVVPSIHQSPEKPVFLKKIAYEHDVYELSWNAPPRS